MSEALARDLRPLVGDAGVLDATDAQWRTDAAGPIVAQGTPDAVVAPQDTEAVAKILRWCYEHTIPVVPRGGGSGLTGGAVADGGVLLCLGRMTRVRELEPLAWRMHVDAGVTTATVQRHARENGLLFPPDPGAAEQSQIGGNVATNAGGPHAFKYGVTRQWVTGLEAVTAEGEVLELGGAVRKNASGFDLTAQLVGSEGCLAVVTGVWLRLVPRPAARRIVIAGYGPEVDAGDALAGVFASGAVPAAVEYLDAGVVAALTGDAPVALGLGDALVLVVEADGAPESVAWETEQLRDAMGEEAAWVETVDTEADVRAVWGWRERAPGAVVAVRGAKLSEDVVVPPEQLGAFIAELPTIGARHSLPTASWGHAGDGNAHASFLVDPQQPAERDAALAGAGEVFDLAVRLGGRISGEHGIGLAKRDALERHSSLGELDRLRALKRTWDTTLLLNPGKVVRA